MMRILTDLMLPGLYGKIIFHVNFIMLMISSNDKKGNYLKCITLGIDHYLDKAF